MKFLRKRRVRGNVDSWFNSDYHSAAQPSPNDQLHALGPPTERTLTTFHVPIHEGLMAIQSAKANILRMISNETYQCRPGESENVGRGPYPRRHIVA